MSRIGLVERAGLGQPQNAAPDADFLNLSTAGARAEDPLIGAELAALAALAESFGGRPQAECPELDRFELALTLAGTD